MTEVEELRDIVRAQSKLLTILVQYLREGTSHLDEDESAELWETICEGLTPHQVRTHFPDAPEWLRMN